MHATKSAWKRSDIIAAISVLFTILVFGAGLWQYHSSETWKRSEFVANQIKEFNSDKINAAVLMMMDYDPAHVELFPEKPTETERYSDVNLSTLTEAVRKDRDFTSQEFQARIYFEHLLTSLSRFNYFIDRRVIEPRELCADVSYPVALMTGDAKDMKLKNQDLDISPFSSAVQGYLARWQSKEIEEFFDRIRNACR